MERNRWDNAARNAIREWFNTSFEFEVNESICEGSIVVDDTIDTDCEEWDAALSSTIAELRRVVSKPERPAPSLNITAKYAHEIDEIVKDHFVKFLTDADPHFFALEIQANISNDESNDVNEVDWNDTERDTVTTIIADKIRIAIDAIRNS